MKYKYLIALFFFFTSCAKIPIQSVDLAEALKQEGERMHTLNIKLINKIFQDKKLLINEVIVNEYLPQYIENFKTKIPASVDYKASFSDLVQASYPALNATRDSLLNETDNAKNLIIDKLNKDYLAFSGAFDNLENLLKSGARLNAEKSNFFAKIKDLTKGKIDADAIEKAVNKFITDAGKIGDKASTLNETINLLLK